MLVNNKMIRLQSLAQTLVGANIDKKIQTCKRFGKIYLIHLPVFISQ